MPYATAAELLDRFDAEEIAQRADRGTPRLVTAALLRAAAAGDSLAAYTEDEQAAAATALALIERALADAGSTIDGYLAGRYAVPLASPPTVVGRMACDLVRYYLHDGEMPEAVDKRHTAAVAWLRDVSAGKVSLGPDLGAAAQPKGGSVEMVSDATAFGRKNSGGFI